MDIERVVAKRIMDETGIKTVLEVPATRPDEFVSVEMTGGTNGRFMQTAILAIQTWATTRRRAAEMAVAVQHAVFNLTDEQNIFKATPGGAYRYPDPDSKSERYQINVDLTLCN